MTTDELTSVRKFLFSKEGLNVDGIRDTQLERRIASYSRRQGFTDIDAMLRALETDRQLRDQFVDGLTINVTNLFRNAADWEFLRTDILPQLGPEPKLWSAGCSTGAEPCTMSMLVRDLGLRVDILATDIDARALGRAASGMFGKHELREVPADYLDRYFTIDDDSAQINAEVLQGIRFGQQDLLNEPLPTGFDLIACRNVVIYFSAESRESLHHKLSESLKPGGVLFVGGAERVSNPASIGLQLIRPHFYRKLT